MKNVFLLFSTNMRCSTSKGTKSDCFRVFSMFKRYNSSLFLSQQNMREAVASFKLNPLCKRGSII